MRNLVPQERHARESRIESAVSDICTVAVDCTGQVCHPVRVASRRRGPRRIYMDKRVRRLPDVPVVSPNAWRTEVIDPDVINPGRPPRSHW